ncbi:hypothetical protein [Streptomyces sp. BE303]|uniref:hypothetical protein n=1 Tax=Streptomyces sp. BE303 TaxID=3002528 RepID=UPI002E7852B9|nr:hypothetical protein [Streptomyces sp. BE303]MED7950477.1 hypothetical protein [Streptomyces sp. BE303]
MSSTIPVRRSRRTLAVAAAVAALAGSLMLPAQAAFADSPDYVKGAKLSVQAPAVIGFGGQPVRFTESVTNTGERATNFKLNLLVTAAVGAPQHSLTIDYKDPASGAWKPVEMAYHHGENGTSYDGTVSGITVAVGKTVKVDLRIGAPVDRPNDGGSNAGFQSLKLRSAVGWGQSGVLLAENFSTIKVATPTSSLAHVPATAVAGGAPIEFDAVLSNSTPSSYVGLGSALFVGDHATVQVRRADGTWTTPTKVSGGLPGDPPGVYLQGRDATVGAGKTTVTKVRVSYDRSTPPGVATLNPCLFVNAGSPFRGTARCGKAATVKVVAPGTGTSGAGTSTPAPTKSPTKAPAKSATPAPTKAAPAKPATPAPGKEAPGKDVSVKSPAPTASASPTAAAAAPGTAAPTAPVDGELAATGSGSTLVPAAAATALAALGAGALLLARRLRRQA